MKKILMILLAAALLLSCLGCGAGESAGENASVTFFKAGKADAAVVTTDDAVILVDTGLDKNGGELVESLEAMGVERIDVLVISHFDKDHVGGADAILDAFEVGTVYQSNCPKDSDDYEEYRNALDAAGIEPITVKEAVSFTLDGLEVTIDGPDAAEYADDPSNNSSLIAAISCGGTTLLFAGDAQNARLAEYLATFQRPDGTVILKVPYHGHWQEMLPAFLEAVAPDTAVISCSKDEPDEDELTRTEAVLASLGAVTHCTYNGDITLSLP